MRRPSIKYYGAGHSGAVIEISPEETDLLVRCLKIKAKRKASETSLRMEDSIGVNGMPGLWQNDSVEDDADWDSVEIKFESGKILTTSHQRLASVRKNCDGFCLSGNLPSFLVKLLGRSYRVNCTYFLEIIVFLSYGKQRGTTIIFVRFQSEDGSRHVFDG